MIISHKHKFIFIKTRKTAGTTAEIALSKICGPDDIITPVSGPDEAARQEIAGRGAQNYKIGLKQYRFSDLIPILRKQRLLQYYNHITAEEIYRFIGPEIWNSYYKFTIERNPFDKAVSFYYWRKADKENMPLIDFFRSPVFKRLGGAEVYSLNGEIAVDKVYKFEEMSTIYSDLSDKLNLSEALEIPEYRAKGNFRKKRDYRELYDAESKAYIEEHFAKELALLDYSF